MSQLFDVFLVHLNDWLNAGNLIEGALIVALVFEIKRLRQILKEYRKSG